MGAFISQQPNGLYCRFSTVIDCPTHYNMTRDDYVECVMESQGLRKEIAEVQADDVLNNHLRPFSWVLDMFIENNMPFDEFVELIKEMGYNGRFEHIKNDNGDIIKTIHDMSR